jgi:hypothetical protein
MLSRNSSSSRAIPTEKLIQRVVNDPVVPLYIGANQKGMQTGAELPEEARKMAVEEWLRARDNAVGHARFMLGSGVHKAIVNRLIEPWMWITVIISATEWDNFFGLRLHKDAEPHFQYLARLMKESMDLWSSAHRTQELSEGAWHLPLWGASGDFDEACALAYVKNGMSVEEIAKRVSVGRCARVSYLTHDGRRDLVEDIALHDRLIVAEPLHASPAEHVAQALATPERIGNFVGWKQLRKFLPNENIGGPL